MSNNWPTKKWSADDTAVLMRGFETNRSFEAMALELGRTRNSVAGKMHRLGLKRETEKQVSE